MNEILIQIVAFIILHFLRFLTSIGDFIILWNKSNVSNYDLQHDRGIPTWLEIVTILSNLCMVINASVNFLIYLYLNPTTPSNRVTLAIPRYLRPRPSLRQNAPEEIALQNLNPT